MAETPQSSGMNPKNTTEDDGEKNLDESKEEIVKENTEKELRELDDEITFHFRYDAELGHSSTETKYDMKRVEEWMQGDIAYDYQKEGKGVYLKEDLIKSLGRNFDNLYENWNPGSIPYTDEIRDLIGEEPEYWKVIEFKLSPDGETYHGRFQENDDGSWYIASIDERGIYSSFIFSREDAILIWENVDDRQRLSGINKQHFPQVLLDEILNSPEFDINSLNSFDWRVIMNEGLFNTNETVSRENIQEQLQILTQKLKESGNKENQLRFLMEMGETLGTHYDVSSIEWKKFKWGNPQAPSELIANTLIHEKWLEWETQLNEYLNSKQRLEDRLERDPDDINAQSSLWDLNKKIDTHRQNEPEYGQSSANCTHISIALKEIAGMMDIPAEVANVGSGIPHFLTGITMGKGTPEEEIVLLDYGSETIKRTIKTGEKTYDRALVAYEKDMGIVILNRLSDESGINPNTNAVVKTDTYKEKEKYMYGEEGEIGSHIARINSVPLPNGMRVEIGNKSQEITLKKGNLLLTLGHDNYEHKKNIAYSDLFGGRIEHEISDFLVSGLKIHSGASVVHQKFKPFAEGFRAQKNTDVSLNADITQKVQLVNKSDHNLSLANTIGGLVSSFYHSTHESFGLSEIRATDVGSVMYSYIDPAKPNEFYILAGPHMDLATTIGERDFNILYHGFHAKSGMKLQARKGVIVNADISATEYGQDYTEMKGNISVESSKGSISLSGEKNFDYSNRNLVNEDLSLEGSIQSPTMRIKNVDVNIELIGEKSENNRIGVRVNLLK